MTILNFNDEERAEEWVPISFLLQEMKKAGTSWYSRSSILLLENKGKLSFLRSKRWRSDRLITSSMVSDIISAFLPGGRGEWHFSDWSKKNAWSPDSIRKRKGRQGLASMTKSQRQRIVRMGGKESQRVQKEKKQHMMTQGTYAQ